MGRATVLMLLSAADLTNAVIGGITTAMGRGFCVHAYRSPHAIDRTHWFYVCRLCGDIITLKFDVEKGQIIDNVMRKRIENEDNEPQKDAI